MQVVAAVVTLTLLLGSRSALADEAHVSVDSGGVEGCITAEELAQRIEEAGAGRTVPRDVRLNVSIEPRGEQGLQARLAWLVDDRPVAERTLDSAQSRCRELDAALLLVATTLLDELHADIVPNQPERAPAPPPDTQPPTSIVRAEPQAQAQAKPPPSSPHRDRDQSSALLAGASVALGVLPEATLGPRLDYRARVAKRWSVWLGAYALPWGSSRTVERSRIDFMAATVTAAACYLPLSFPDATIDACGGVSAGVLATTGTEIRGAPSTARPLVWPVMATALSSPLGSSLVLRAHIAGGPALFRNEYVVTDWAGSAQVVRRAAPVLVEGGLALGFLL